MNESKLLSPSDREEIENIIKTQVVEPGGMLLTWSLLDVEQESRLRFNAIVEAQVFTVVIVAKSENRQIRETWELVMWPSYAEWDVHLLGTEPD